MPITANGSGLVGLALRQIPAGGLRVAERPILRRIARLRGRRVLIGLRILYRRFGRLGFVLHKASSLREFDEFLVIDDYLQARVRHDVRFI